MSDNFREFVQMFNRIDALLRRELNLDERISFPEVIRQFGEERSRYRHLEQLSLFGRFRNLLVHAESLVDPLFQPSDEAVLLLQIIYEDLAHPVTAAEKFAGPVTCVTPETLVTEVLSLIRERDYTQFPVYGGGELTGLITENGIVRWLAAHVSTEDSLIELEDYRVASVLEAQPDRECYEVASLKEPVDATAHRFFRNLELQAVVFTEHGQSHEPPQAIATVWDIVRSET